MKIEGNTIGEKIEYLCRNNDEAEIYNSPHFVIIKASKVMNFLITSAVLPLYTR